MKEYKGYYLPTKRHRKMREYIFAEISDIEAAKYFTKLCKDSGWELVNVFNDKREALFTNGVLNV